MWSIGYAFGTVRSTPAQDEALRQRLEWAVTHHANGSADKLGRMLGYANGGYIREVINKVKPAREKLIERVNAHPTLRGLFDGVLTEVSAADVARHAPAAAAPAAEWPFQQIPPAMWATLSDQDRHAIERAAVKELLSIQADRRALGEFNPLQSSDTPRRAVA